MRFGSRFGGFVATWVALGCFALLELDPIAVLRGHRWPPARSAPLDGPPRPGEKIPRVRSVTASPENLSPLAPPQTDLHLT